MNSSAAFTSLKTQLIQNKNSFFSQKSKRTIKIEALEKLGNMITNHKSNNPSTQSILENSAFKNHNSQLFQSFFRNKSDTQDIFEAADVYLQKGYKS
jgi:hypothetical protein